MQNSKCRIISVKELSCFALFEMSCYICGAVLGLQTYNTESVSIFSIDKSGKFNEWRVGCNLCLALSGIGVGCCLFRTQSYTRANLSEISFQRHAFFFVCIHTNN